MRLLLDDALATAPCVLPLSAGWLETLPSGVTLEVRTGLAAEAIGADDAALVPSGELYVLQATHRVAPDVAVVFADVGTVVLRCPVRPDEVEATPVKLWGTSSFGEVLARATVRPFYGIPPQRWSVSDEPEAQAVVVEGPEALRPPEAGYSEDLSRAWFIMTGEPAVGHVLVVPRAAERGDLAPVFSALTALRETGAVRRRDVRRALVEAHGVPQERVNALHATSRFALDPTDRRSLLMLLQQGHPGGQLPLVRGLDYLEAEG